MIQKRLEKLLLQLGTKTVAPFPTGRGQELCPDCGLPTLPSSGKCNQNLCRRWRTSDGGPA